MWLFNDFFSKGGICKKLWKIGTKEDEDEDEEETRNICYCW